MTRILLIPLTLWIGLATTQARSAVTLPSTPLPANLTLGDELFRQRAELVKAQRARDLYLRELVSAPTAEAGWRFAMASYFVGLRTPDLSDSERGKIFDSGLDAGREALKTSPDCVPCHFWTAINLALHAKYTGIFNSLFALPEVRSHLETVCKRDPGYAYGGAFRLLGLIEQNLPGILGGSDDRAEEYFRKAIEAAGDEPLNYLFLARLLDKNLHRPQEARATAGLGLKLPAPSTDRVESTEAIADLKAWQAENP